MNLAQIIENSLYFLVLVNPITKVLFVTSRYPAYLPRELKSISIRSTIAAFLILVILASIGDFLFIKIFRVEIYSLSVAGGIILFIIGLKAVNKGKFFESGSENDSSKDIAVVPLAAPLIAGPGAMTAAISFASINGSITTIICIAVATLINFACMLFSFQISRILDKFNATETLIRITGLIVTAVAMQMIFAGCTTWAIKVL